MDLTISISVRALPRIIGTLMESALTLQQLRVLTAVVVDEQATTSRLAAKFTVSNATMSKLIDRLVVGGLVERIVDVDDQRVRWLRSTELGRSVVSGVMGARPDVGGGVLDHLDADELHHLALGLRAVDRGLRELDVAEPGVAPGA